MGHRPLAPPCPAASSRAPRAAQGRIRTAVTQEAPQTLGGSAAPGTAGGSPQLPALPSSSSSRARGPARHSQPRAMMKTLSSGNCTLSVPAKNSYRMVVLGASRVGKSSIVSRFLNGRFEDQYTPTIEDFHRKVYNIRGDMYQLDILDTSGNHPFPAMRRLSILTGDVFILVFSLDNRESFDEVKRLQKQILEVKSCLKNKTKEAAELPMVICGNKNDHGELCRQVPTTEAELLVSGDENCAYFEVSAKKNTNVDEMFYVLFSMAKLPHEMSPALHRKISVQYGDAFHPRPFCMRRIKEVDAYGMVSPFARRPSVNSDLKYIKAKVLREGQARERDKCTIQ
nr:GTP-binding protein Rhes [Aotus nancymaae]